ncbi:MAG: hypothetical protein J7J82_05615 [Staphylothermus sp.]|nr:hypothetical protein [Staphylothermus sp.]
MSTKNNPIIELIEKLPGNNEEKIYSLALILVLRDQPLIGRRRLSKILGLSERRVRTLIEKLIKHKMIEKNVYALKLSANTIKLLENINIKRITNKYKISMISIIPNLCSILEEKIMVFRDHLVINIKDPNSIEVICCQTNSNIIIPRVPEYLKKKYEKIINKYVSSTRQDELIIFWKNYQPYLYDASVLLTISIFFKNI